MVVCGLCGRRATGTSNGQPKNPYAYYRCTRYGGPIGAQRCSDPPVSARWIERAVWSRIREFLESPEVFLAQMDTEEATRVQTIETIRVNIVRLERQVREYEGYRQRAFDLLVKGTTDENTYQRSVAGYGAHLAWLDEELSRQRADAERAEVRQWSVEVIKALYPKLQAALDTATWEDRRFVLECLQTRVVLEGRKATVELAVPEYIVGAVSTTPRETPPQAPKT
ncbi:MAG: zinc ribbon domain-containing protein [Chloroflexi bacterium]|nr:zinc ribbon domain-containing protein [Chloroflexota bacterium]